ncbi:MAG: SRPBCC domain-containing protein [Saprospiraceae bacterium]
MEEINETILIKKIFNASLEEVWKAWTDPEYIMKWFGSDPNGKVLKASIDVKPDGHFEITFQDSDSTEHTCTGVYKDVQILKKLAFTWMWKNEPGVESFVTILFQTEGYSTRMHFEHAGTGTESKHGYYQGWLDTFSKLDRVLST